MGDPGSIPWWGRSPGERNGYPSSILAWRIPWTEEPGGLQSMGSQRVGHDRATSLSLTDLYFGFWILGWMQVLFHLQYYFFSWYCFPKKDSPSGPTLSSAINCGFQDKLIINTFQFTRSVLFSRKYRQLFFLTDQTVHFTFLS